MLSLTFAPGQTLVIGDDIRVTVTEIKWEDGEVRLAIDAPRHVPLNRGKIYESKRRENGGRPLGCRDGYVAGRGAGS